MADFFKKFIKKCRTNIPFAISLTVFLIAFTVFVVLIVTDVVETKRIDRINNEYKHAMELAELTKTPTPVVTNTNTPEPTNTPKPSETPEPTFTPTPTPSPSPAMTASGQAAYEKNHDYVGWLEILGEYSKEDSDAIKNRVDHPVFQTFDDPSTPYDPKDDDTNEGWYYLYRDANGEKNKFGSLFVDEACTIGKGTKENNYENGVKPSSNIIIYGHNYVRYIMFGALKQYWPGYYKKFDFYEAHSRFSFTTCYETREYEIVAIFEDSIPEDDTYYFGSFINCYSQAQFDQWISFLKNKTVKKIDFTAEYGDEFVTLITCAREGESPIRTVVVGRRIK